MTLLCLVVVAFIKTWLTLIATDFRCCVVVAVVDVADVADDDDGEGNVNDSNEAVATDVALKIDLHSLDKT